MQCPKCTANTQVLQTRANSSKLKVQRRRECVKCKHRFSSYEITSDDLGQMKKLMTIASQFLSIDTLEAYRLKKLTRNN